MTEQRLYEILNSTHGLEPLHKSHLIIEAMKMACEEYSDQQNAELRERVKELEGAIDTAIGLLKITSSPYAQDEEAIATAADILFESKKALKK